MKRQWALIRFALGSARRRLGRTVTLGFALGLVTAALSAVLFLTEALRHEFRQAAEALPDLTVQQLAAGRPVLIPEDVTKRLSDLPGIAAVQPRVWGYHFVPSLSGNFTVVGLDNDEESVRRNLALVPVAGRLPQPGVAGEVLMGEALAKFFGLRPGEAVILPLGDGEKRLQLTGIFHSDVALWTADVILMSREDAREFLRVPPGYCTDLAVRLSTPDEAQVVARKIAERLPGVRIVDRQLMARTYDLTFDARGGMLGAMLTPALVAFLVLAWDRLTGAGPDEKHEIGVLKAIGWQTGEVILARLWENTIIGFQGAAAGILVAYFYVFGAHAPGLAEILFGWSTLYPVLRLTPAVDAAQLSMLLSLAVIPFVAASLVPVWRMATRDPHLLLRGTA